MNNVLNSTSSGIDESLNQKLMALVGMFRTF